MPIEDKIMGWMKNLGELIIPGEGGEKADLFESRLLPPSWVKSAMAMETSEQMGGEFQMDEGIINVLTENLEVIEFDEDMTEVTNILGKDVLEARGETGSGGIIDSFIAKYQNSESRIAEIDLKGSTVDGKEYNFTLITKPDESGESKFFLF